MKLSSFSVKGLYHTFNYDFTIKNDEQSFIITGPNGFGKTTILRILSSLYNRNLLYFYSLPFDEILLKFDGDVQIVVKSEYLSSSSTIDESRQRNRDIVFTWIYQGEKSGNLRLNDKIYQKASRRYRSEIDRAPFYNLYRTDTFETYYEKHPAQFERLFSEQDDAQMLFLQLQTLNIHMLSSNRLAVSIGADGTQIESIDQVSKSLQETISETYLLYLKEVNKSNEGLYDKLLSEHISISKEDYERRSAELMPKMQQLYNWGLVSEKNIRPFNEENANILSIYLEELSRNISCYDKIYNKLTLFAKILSEKHFSNKHISFNPNHGITAILDYDSSPLELRKLSSGEQHEIIILYNSIFAISEGSILLVDEPENSLHVAWQNTFVNDISLICEALNAQVIIATHSPHIIGGRYNDCFDLYEQVEGE